VCVQEVREKPARSVSAIEGRGERYDGMRGAVSVGATYRLKKEEKAATIMSISDTIAELAKRSRSVNISTTSARKWWIRFWGTGEGAVGREITVCWLSVEVLSWWLESETRDAVSEAEGRVSGWLVVSVSARASEGVNETEGDEA